MERKTPVAQVGLFVLVGLLLIGGLLLRFSKGASFWSSGRTVLV